jgi:hypothetical protein
MKPLELTHVHADKLLEILELLYPEYDKYSIDTDAYNPKVTMFKEEEGSDAFSWFEMVLYHIPKRAGDTDYIRNWMIAKMGLKNPIHPVDFLHNKIINMNVS